MNVSDLLADVFLPFQITKLGRSDMFGTLEDARQSLSLRGTFLEGRSRALLKLAQKNFHADAKPYRLVPRDAHLGMLDCPHCKKFRDRRAELRAMQAPKWMYAENDADILAHRNHYMGERQAPFLPMRLCQALFRHQITVCQALEVYRNQAGREDTIFFQRDGCGSDVLNLPASSRRSSTTSDEWQYKLGMQCEMIRGKLMTLSLLPPHLRKGANFGATSFLNFIVDMQVDPLAPPPFSLSLSLCQS